MFAAEASAGTKGCDNWTEMHFRGDGSDASSRGSNMRDHDYPFRGHRCWGDRVKHAVTSQTMQVPLAALISCAVFFEYYRPSVALRHVLMLGLLLSRNPHICFSMKKTVAYRRSWIPVPSVSVVHACFWGAWAMLAVSALMPDVSDGFLYAAIAAMALSLLVNRETTAYFCCDEYLAGLIAQVFLDGPRKFGFCYGGYLAHGGLWKSFRGSYRGRFYMSSESIYNLCLPLRSAEAFLWRRNARGGWEPNGLAMAYAGAAGLLEFSSGVLLMCGSRWGAYGAIMMHSGIIGTLSFPEANLWNFCSALSVWLALPHIAGPPVTLADWACSLGPFLFHLYNHFDVAAHQLIGQHFCSNFQQYEEILFVDKKTVRSVLHDEYARLVTPKWMGDFTFALSEMPDFLRRDTNVDFGELKKKTDAVMTLTNDHVAIRVSKTLSLHMLGSVTENALMHLEPPFIAKEAEDNGASPIQYRLRMWATRDFGRSRYFKLENLVTSFSGTPTVLVDGHLRYTDN